MRRKPIAPGIGEAVQAAAAFAWDVLATFPCQQHLPKRVKVFFARISVRCMLVEVTKSCVDRAHGRA
jgi:hypothetical protein